MKHDKVDLERELRANRAQPRADFARALGDEVQTRRASERSPMGRVGLALALSGLIVVAFASFGGIGYASSTASHAVKKPTAVRVVKSSAAHAQYAVFTPPTAKAKAKAEPQAAAAAVKSQKAAPKVTSSQLPFTGLTLWVPLAIGLMLISLGLVLRTRGRRRHSGAH